MNQVMYVDNFGPMFGLPAPTSFVPKEQIAKYSLSFLNWEPGATPIYYMLSDGEWKWTPDSCVWMPVSTDIVSEGMWAGQVPVPGNVKLIEALRNVNPVIIVRSIDERDYCLVIMNSQVRSKTEHLCLTEEFVVNHIKMVRVWKNLSVVPHRKMDWLFI
eukprot:TRINITY_DN6419_c0_g1_i2.p1 TRINITY_DN6419_c0_g1~~TRINITY_DN6419_c0_g1_i2.p1  ORF type:complete len:159 (+),score=12.29 TRINITY_DN6419_c0_g1_i2:150-626(+)